MGTFKNTFKTVMIAAALVTSADFAAAGERDPFFCRTKIRAEMGIPPYMGYKYPGFWARVGRCISARGSEETARALGASEGTRSLRERVAVRETVDEPRRKKAAQHVERRKLEPQHPDSPLIEARRQPADQPPQAPAVSNAAQVAAVKSASLQAPAQVEVAQPSPVQPALSTSFTSPASSAAAVASPAMQTPSAPLRLSALPGNQNAAPFGRRVALVIGNGRYDHVATLPHAINDAEALAKALLTTGFQSVTLRENLTRDQMFSALTEFAKVADTADWAAVYYSGHGIEARGINYMVPVDAELKVDRDVDLEAVDVGKVLSAIDGARRLKLVILDACRDNPFLEHMKRTVASRSITRGLARVEPEAGVLIVYAAKHGEVALDGAGQNSPFATALLNRMQTPNLELRRLFDLVRDDVMATTNQRQQPFSYGSLSGSEDFFFGTN
jgi:hypothetical protein